MDVVSQGSINEFAVSMGANFNNVVYVGATIGIRSVYKKVGMTYQEEYGYFDANGHATLRSIRTVPRSMRSSIT